MTLSKLDKAYKFFVVQYLFDYEGKYSSIVQPILH